MRRLGIGAGVAVLGLMVGAALARADDTEGDKPAAPSFWSRMWPGKAAKAAKPDDEDDDKPDKPGKPAKPEPKVPAQAGPTAREKAIAQREKEKANFLRRQAACTRLMQIALETDDLDLYRRAEELNERAWTIYSQRTAALPSAPGAAADAADGPPVVPAVLKTNKPDRGSSSIRGLNDVDEVPKQALRKEKP